MSTRAKVVLAIVACFVGIAQLYVALVQPEPITNLQFAVFAACGLMIVYALASILVERAAKLPELGSDCRTVLKYISDREPCEVSGIAGVPIEGVRHCLDKCAGLGLIMADRQVAAGGLYGRTLYRIIPRYREAIKKL